MEPEAAGDAAAEVEAGNCGAPMASEDGVPRRGAVSDPRAGINVGMPSAGEEFATEEVVSLMAVRGWRGLSRQKNRLMHTM